MLDLTCLYQINVQARSLGTQILTNARKYVPNEKRLFNTMDLLSCFSCYTQLAYPKQSRLLTWFVQSLTIRSMLININVEGVPKLIIPLFSHLAFLSAHLKKAFADTDPPVFGCRMMNSLIG